MEKVVHDAVVAAWYALMDLGKIDEQSWGHLLGCPSCQQSACRISALAEAIGKIRGNDEVPPGCFQTIELAPILASQVVTELGIREKLEGEGLLDPAGCDALGALGHLEGCVGCVARYHALADAMGSSDATAADREAIVAKLRRYIKEEVDEGKSGEEAGSASHVS